MCKYNIAIDDAVMEEVRPTITEGMEEDAWVQLQVEMLFSQMAEKARNKKKNDLINALTQLKEAMEVAEVDGNVIDMALKSGWKDFEDAVQNFSAVANPQISAIITRNTKDFKDSTLEVVDSVEFLHSK